MQKRLTDAFLRTLHAPAAGRLEVADERCAGLTIRVTANAIKSWSLRFRDPNSGRVVRATIGLYPDVSLEQARERGLALRREIAAGVNPIEKKRNERLLAPSRTFQALADRYMVEHARRHKKTADADARMLRLHVLPHWRARRFESIRRGDVVDLCEKIIENGWPTQANRVQALISKIFSFALDCELVASNPCAGLKKRSKEVRATRVLSDNEIRLFWRRIGESPNSKRIGQALRLLLLTGARVNELAGARIGEFDRLDEAARATWVLPAARSKNGKAHVVPLSELARRIVGDLLGLSLRRTDGERVAEFLLPSPNDIQKPIDGHALSVAMLRFGEALKRADVLGETTREEGEAIVAWTADQPSAHDLRRTLATRLAGSGIPAEDVAACLNHARRGVTAQHYDQYDRAREKRRALDMWAEQIRDLICED